MNQQSSNDDELLGLLETLAEAALRRGDDASFLPSNDLPRQPDDLSSKVNNAIIDVALADHLDLLQSAAAVAAEVDDDVALWAYQPPRDGLRYRIHNAIVGAVPPTDLFVGLAERPSVFIAAPMTAPSPDAVDSLRRQAIDVAISCGMRVETNTAASLQDQSDPVTDAMARLFRCDALIIIEAKQSIGTGIFMTYAERASIPTVIAVDSVESRGTLSGVPTANLLHYHGSKEFASVLASWLTRNDGTIRKRSDYRSGWERSAHNFMPTLKRGVTGADETLLRQHGLSPAEAALMVSSAMALLASPVAQVSALFQVCSKSISLGKGEGWTLDGRSLASLSTAAKRNRWTVATMTELLAVATSAESEGSGRKRVPTYTIEQWWKLHHSLTRSEVAASPLGVDAPTPQTRVVPNDPPAVEAPRVAEADPDRSHWPWME